MYVLAVSHNYVVTVRTVEGISKIIVSMEKLLVMVSFQNNIE